MPYSAAEPLLQSMRRLAGVEIEFLPSAPDAVQQAALSTALSPNVAVEFEVDGSRYLGCRYGQESISVLVAGPYIISDTRRHGQIPAVTSEEQTRLQDALEHAAVGIAHLAKEHEQTVEAYAQFDLVSHAITAITGELSLENVLDRIVELARSVAGAKYAALGVPGPDGSLVTFVTAGISEEEKRRIGNLPRGLGVLGELIHQQRSMRLRNIADHPASVGFPDNHPPMHSFLGVPIISRGVAIGNLYLTEKRFGDEFTAEDERLVELLARHAAVAIENAQLYAQLGRQEEQLRFIIDQLPEAVVLAEPDPERVTLANRQASLLLGWDILPPITLAEFIAGNARYNDVGEQVDHLEIPAVRSLRFGETVTRSELTIERPDGERLTLLTNSAPLRQPDGTITAATIVFQDITQLKDAEQLKDDFLSLVSHELRTPLTTIHGGVHMLLSGSAQLDADTRESILSDILSESKRLATLVENMVQLANIRAGRYRIESEPVHLGMLIKRLVRSLDEQLGGREVRVDLSPQLLASGDTESLDQVLRNLVENAIKYVPDGSPIDIVGREHDGMIHISVRDYGPGIDPDDIPLLFDRFQRGNRSRTTAGMGLGLYLSRMLAEAHGGQLWLELPHDGGSRFVVSVPTASEDPFAE